MAINFATAGTLKAKKPAKKSDKVEIAIDELEVYAALASVEKSIAAMKATIETNVKAKMKRHFVETGCAIHTRPENFRGVDGSASASCELRARASTSSLSADEQELLSKFGIPMRTDTVVAETLVINPAYLSDASLLAKVQKALNGIKGIPDDFVMKQEGVSRTVADTDALKVLFTKTEDTVASLLNVVGVLAIKPVIDDTTKAYEIVRGLFGETVEEKIAA